MKAAQASSPCISPESVCGLGLPKALLPGAPSEQAPSQSKGILTPQSLIRGDTDELVLWLRKCRAFPKLVQNGTNPHPGEWGQLVPGDKEKGLPGGLEQSWEQVPRHSYSRLGQAEVQ